MKLNSMKTPLFIILAFAFVLGCEAQYPKDEVVDDYFIKASTVNSKVDSIKVIIYYQSLDKGVRATGTSEYRANPNPKEWEVKARLIKEVRTDTHNQYARGYADRLRDQIKAREGYPCGFYKLEVTIKGKKYWMRFYSCNPNYLRN